MGGGFGGGELGCFCLFCRSVRRREEQEKEELEGGEMKGGIDDYALASCCRFCSANCSRNNFCLALKASTPLGLMSAREGVLKRIVGVEEKGRTTPHGGRRARRARRDSILFGYLAKDVVCCLERVRVRLSWL